MIVDGVLIIQSGANPASSPEDLLMLSKPAKI